MYVCKKTVFEYYLINNENDLFALRNNVRNLND